VSLGEEASSWSYRHDRDLTCFSEGTENPTLIDAPTAALLPEGVRGAPAVLLLQSVSTRQLQPMSPGRLSGRIAGAVAREFSVTRWCSVVLSRANGNGRRGVSC
jgi:hypothetical protein